MPAKRHHWSEQDMQQAIAEYRAGKYSHAAPAAAAYGIPARTLHWQLQNGEDLSQRKASISCQLLTPAEASVYKFFRFQPLIASLC
jgi:hypothetical protein